MAVEIVDRFTNLEHGKVRYSITGEASDNLVVLMHGLTTSKDIYNNLTQDLIEQGFQVLSFDFYGRGKSDYVPNVESEELYVNQAIELIGETIVIFGILIFLLFFNYKIFIIPTYLEHLL